jgi:multiple sugar transport system substrate-binding protein
MDTRGLKSLSRRQMLRLMALGAGVAATGAVLDACGARPTAPTLPPTSSAATQPTVPDNAVKSIIRPPVVAQPCTPGNCPFQGQIVTVIVTGGGKDGPISGPLYEVREEFEQATGATLNVVDVAFEELFPKLITDLTAETGQYAAAIAAAWWLGDLVDGDLILSYDQWYDDPRFPKWDINNVLPAPRALLEYGGKKYMMPYDHDGQVLYYRRDLLSDPKHRQAFKEKYSYDLPMPPQIWGQFRDVAEYFNGKDLNGDGRPDSGLTLHLKVGGQAMFHFMAFAAPFIISPQNAKLFWFDSQGMKPLLDSPGHVKALQMLVDLLAFAPAAVTAWGLGESWDCFLRGEAALTCTWGDLGAKAQEPGSQVKGKVGAAPIPGTTEYYDLTTGQWIKIDKPNMVGNTVGGSWAGVISKFAKAPEATYYLLALLATTEKSLVYGIRGWDSLDPGRYSEILAPDGTAKIQDFIQAGWDEQDARSYSKAYFDSFSLPEQFPYLRIPGTFEYWSALDVHLSEAAIGQLSPEEALRATVTDFESITDRLGREQQLESYRASLGL